MTETTPRLALPLLAAGQAQKEVFHNEALALLDTLVQPAVASAGANVPPAVPSIGQNWIVGTSPTGAWAGHAGGIASWSDGGWRFAAPAEGMWLWVIDVALWAYRTGGAWTVGPLPATALIVGGQQVVGARRPAVATPSGGMTIDAEARAAVGAILASLRGHGLIAG